MKNIGKFVNKLEFKILKVDRIYHIVVARKRSGNSSRLDKVGFFHFDMKTSLRLMGINFDKMSKYIKKGTTFHRSVLKFIV